MKKDKTLNLVVEKDADQNLVASFLAEGVDLAEMIPNRPDLDAAWDQFEVCLTALNRASEISAMLKPVIGRFLRVAKDNPEFYQRKGFATYEKFLREYVSIKMNMCRSVLYECRDLADKLPDLTPTQFKELGSTKAKALARVTHSSNADFKELVKLANESTSVEFVRALEEKGRLEAGEIEPIVIVIPANEKVRKVWEEFVQMPEVHSYVGSSNPGTILERLMEEASYWGISQNDASLEKVAE